MMKPSVGRRTDAVAPTMDDSRSATDRDSGATLIEVLITIVLMATVLVTLMVAVVTGIRASVDAKGAAEIETMLINVGDRINRAPNTLCDYAPFAQYAAETYDWEGEMIVTQFYYRVQDVDADGQPDLEYPGQWVSKPSGDLYPACRGTSREKQEVSLVVVEVHAADSNMARTIKVVKSGV